ncbi:MAG: hypothetical protein WC410_02800 [Candidatus Paceibacterota bacterium]|nr:hypothetical protein [Candidatus Paceibacterota bacterium]
MNQFSKKRLMELNAEEKKKALSEFIVKASPEIIDAAKKQALKRGFNSEDISKIEAGDYVTGGVIFWVKVCERQRTTEEPSREIVFFEDVWISGYYWPLHIKVTF